MTMFSTYEILIEIHFPERDFHENEEKNKYEN